MTDAQFHSYRFNDETDPTDEQLAELMRQAAADARAKGRIANEKFFDELHRLVKKQNNALNPIAIKYGFLS